MAKEHRGGALGMSPGDRVVHDLTGRRGILEDCYQDGDAFVKFDDGGPGQVKWNHLSPERSPQVVQPQRIAHDSNLDLPPGTPILVFIPHIPYSGWYRAKSDHYWWRAIATHWMRMPDDP